MRKLLIAVAKVIAPFKVEVHEVEMLEPPAVIELKTR